MAETRKTRPEDRERLQRAMDLLDGGVSLGRIADLLDSGAGTEAIGESSEPASQPSEG